jgi:putative ABC transport system permease protein
VRVREVAVRAALGAVRGRLIAQFLTESVILAGLGTIVGLVLAVPAMRFLERLVPETMGIAHLTLDWRVLAFSGCVAIAATLIFGLAPALRGSRISPQDGMREGGRGTAGARSHWLQHSLIVVETALAVVLLTSGGLLLQTFQHLQNTDLGIRKEKLLTFETPLFHYKDFDKRVAFVSEELEKIHAIPGVLNAGGTSTLPLTPHDATATFYKFAGQTQDEVSGQVALIRFVTRDYLATMGARMREGRFFDVSDPRSESKMVIVNESFANRNFSGHSALGERFKFGNLGDQGYWYMVVGVIREIHEVGMEEEPRPAVYCLHDQANDQLMIGPGGIVVRISMNPAAIISAVRAAIWSIDKNQPIWRVQTLEQILDRQISTPSQSTALMGVFALLGLLLASLGLYGVLSWAVTQRMNEIGVRMALGATSNDVLLSFSGRGLRLTLIGLAIGLLLAVIVARFMTAMFYGFQPHLIPTVTVASVALFAVAGLACFIPARRAAKVDPMVALRYE